ncbi:MAG: isochorismatase family protein [Maricaulaceae bacterium]|nr:isochorismatase family protein [Maricaulaceae bacterium]
MMMRPPLLVLMDCQREYTTEDRPLFVRGHKPVISAIGKLLAVARRTGWRIAHCQLKRPDGVFDARSRLSAPISELAPLTDEAIFARAAPSIYSETGFERLVDDQEMSPVYVCGFAHAETLPATVFDADARGHSLTIVSDAVAAPSERKASAADAALALLSGGARRSAFLCPLEEVLVSEAVGDRYGEMMQAAANEPGAAEPRAGDAAGLSLALGWLRKSL